MRRFVVSVLVGGTLALVQIVNVFACLEWCGEDPPVTVVTPQGHSVVVHVTDYALGLQFAPQLARAQISYTVEAKEVGGVDGTWVSMRDTIPSGSLGGFRTAADVSYLGARLDRTTGHSDHTMRLGFFIPVK